MTKPPYRILLFLKDFTGGGGDQFYWYTEGSLVEASAGDVVSFSGTVVCHDFWMIRDALFGLSGDLPATIVDLDEFRISISGKPADRISRERLDITSELVQYGISAEIASVYRRMFNRGIAFDADTATIVAGTLESYYHALCEAASSDGELARFFDVEVPVYRLLQLAMATGISVDTRGLSSKRAEAEHDYYYCLKHYSAKHEMPLETPTQSAIAHKLEAAGFDFEGVSTDYVLEYIPHYDDFGTDTLSLLEFDAAKRVLSSLALSEGRTHPIIDVFGSRTSRVHLRSPSLQNMPKKFRSIIAAAPGAELAYVDFDQYEVGIMAALSQDDALKSLYVAGDMYELFATNHLGLNGNRKAAKQLFLSYAYGMSRKALIDAAVSLGAERGRAKRAFNVFETYENWKKTVWAQLQQEGRVSTVMGNHYKRNRDGPTSAKEQRSAVSQVVQGTASRWIPARSATCS